MVFSGDLQDYLRGRREQSSILLMTHIVLGYPSFDDCLRIVEQMVESGVELMELQIPFSEPIADGPVILRANAEALARGARLEQSLRFAEAVTRRFDIPFLFMTYYNILYRFGVEKFVKEMAQVGIRGAIVPDLPPEEAELYLSAMQRERLDPVFILSPRTDADRMQALANAGRGLMYCVARKGVTGAQTNFSTELDAYLSRCRSATKLPLALGFGVKSREDVQFLEGKVEVAVVGTQTILEVESKGVQAVGPFIRSLRPEH